jgi:hypothetical protein
MDSQEVKNDPPAESTQEDSKDDSDNDSEWVGPLPSEATEHQPKKRKVLHHEKLFLDK